MFSKIQKTYIVAGRLPWNKRVFDEVISNLPGEWHFIQSREDLSHEFLQQVQPRYIFFLHWSWLVPEDMLYSYECVCFHMTDVPYGRGGSPLQNLIARRYRSTWLTALRMVEDFDAGPVYLKKDLCLEGNAEEIYIRATYLTAEMIAYIIQEHPEPEEQTGEVVVFKRRKPSQSAIPPMENLQALQDFIRMLDAEGYPHAFLEHNGFRYTFRRSALYEGRIVADVTITPVKEKQK